MKTEYLLFNLSIFLSSMMGVVMYPGARWPRLRPAIKAVSIVSGIYIIWDFLVTNDWWWFQEKYILGWKVGVLPIEEIAFFVVIPWSCLIIWENLKYRQTGMVKAPSEYIVMCGASIEGLIAIWKAWPYTFVVAVVTFIVACMSLYNNYWLRKRVALIFLTICSVLTLICNGYLTARPVVEYNGDKMSNVRVATVPLEDFFYGLSLLSAIVMLYERYYENTSDR